MTSPSSQEIADAIAAVARSERGRPPEDRGDLSASSGTVVGINRGDLYVDVLIDGDTQPTAYQSLVDVVVGARVLVVFAPPSGAYVAGQIDQLLRSPVSDVWAATCDANGTVEFAHGAPYRPRVVSVTPYTPGVGVGPFFTQFTALNWDDTIITVRCLSQTGAALAAGTAVTGSYTVWP